MRGGSAQLRLQRANLCTCRHPGPRRFTDVKQLFFEAQAEAVARRGRDVDRVRMPDMEQLTVNYRTHS